MAPNIVKASTTRDSLDADAWLLAPSKSWLPGELGLRMTCCAGFLCRDGTACAAWPWHVRHAFVQPAIDNFGRSQQMHWEFVSH